MTIDSTLALLRQGHLFTASAVGTAARRTTGPPERGMPSRCGCSAGRPPEGCPVPTGQRALLDVLATNHDPQEWDRPETFDLGRFLGTGAVWSDHFVPQGGGRPETGHRCPGELVTVRLLALTVSRLSGLDAARARGQDAGWSWRRIPTLPRSGVVAPF